MPRCFQREAPAAIPAAAQTFSTSPGRNGEHGMIQDRHRRGMRQRPEPEGSQRQRSQAACTATIRPREKLPTPRRQTAEIIGATTG